MQSHARRASPSKIPGWIESHAPGRVCKFAARTDPQDPDPDPGVRPTPGMPECLAPCRPRFCFGKQSCQLPLSASAEANVASKCWVASLVISVHGIQVGSTRLGLSLSASLLLACSHLVPRQLKQFRDKLERQDGWQLEKGLGWVGPAGTIEDMDQCIALQSGLFLIEFVSLAPEPPSPTDPDPIGARAISLIPAMT